MRYRDENSEVGRTNTVKRMMEVSEAMKPSIRILNLYRTIYDVVAFLIKPLNIFLLRNKPIDQRKYI